MTENPLSERMKRAQETTSKVLKTHPTPSDGNVLWIDERLLIWIPEVEALEGEVQRLTTENKWLWMQLEQLGYNDGQTEAEVKDYVDTLLGFEDKLIEAEDKLSEARKLPEKWRIIDGRNCLCADELEKVLGDSRPSCTNSYEVKK